MIYIDLPTHYIRKTKAHQKCRSKAFPSAEFLGWVVFGILSTLALLIWWYN